MFARGHWTATALVLVLVVALTTAVDAEVTSNIKGMLVFPPKLPPMHRVPTMLVNLNGGELSTYTNMDGRFEIRHVPVGSYHMSVSHPSLLV
mmetsp:Transcript_15199/g.17213  ORF Transcript_15199/g.17213 Transcript_15199/m.17213 type:complete len:92 (-) Transcript_15199:9-284(-)